MTDPGTDDKAATDAAPDDGVDIADSPATDAVGVADNPGAEGAEGPMGDGAEGEGTDGPDGPTQQSAESGEISDSPNAPGGNSPYDFRQPARLAVDVSARVSEWQQRVASLLPEKLSSHVPSLRCEALTPEVGIPDKVAPPHPLLAFRLQVLGEYETILAIHRPLAVTLVTAMLGEAPESLCEDRELTLVEQSLFDLVVRDLVELLDESGQPLGINVSLIGGERRTQFIRLFPPDKSIALLNFRLEGLFGAADFCWTWPQSLLEATMESDEEKVVSPYLPEIAQRIPFEVVVRLGHAHLTVQQLMQLKPGDIVVLDQPVAEPLVGEVGGREKLRVWPGREGNRQAVQIEEVMED